MGIHVQEGVEEAAPKGSLIEGGPLAQATTRPAPAISARHTHTETRKSFRTTEFYAMLLFVAAVLIATYLDGDSLVRSDGWRYASFAVVAYIISRGLSKLGTREPRTEELETHRSDDGR